jgi:hypothetical protein
MGKINRYSYIESWLGKKDWKHIVEMAIRKIRSR